MRPLITIHNVETNQIIEREMNFEEYEVYLADLAQYEKEQVEATVKAKQRAALLERLGITEDEAKLLLG